ncbi:hypothetical protein GEMRC1_013347 [Eukaryota sp. GEM-RC1]
MFDKSFTNNRNHRIQTLLNQRLPNFVKYSGISLTITLLPLSGRNFFRHKSFPYTHTSDRRRRYLKPSIVQHCHQFASNLKCAMVIVFGDRPQELNIFDFGGLHSTENVNTVRFRLNNFKNVLIIVKERHLASDAVDTLFNQSPAPVHTLTTHSYIPSHTNYVQIYVSDESDLDLSK